MICTAGLNRPELPRNVQKVATPMLTCRCVDQNKQTTDVQAGWAKLRNSFEQQPYDLIEVKSQNELRLHDEALRRENDREEVCHLPSKLSDRSSLNSYFCLVATSRIRAQLSPLSRSVPRHTCFKQARPPYVFLRGLLWGFQSDCVHCNGEATSLQNGPSTFLFFFCRAYGGGSRMPLTRTAPVSLSLSCGRPPARLARSSSASLSCLAGLLPSFLPSSTHGQKSNLRSCGATLQVRGT